MTIWSLQPSAFLRTRFFFVPYWDRDQGRGSVNYPNPSGRGVCTQPGGSQKTSYQDKQQFSACPAEVESTKALEAQAAQIKELQAALLAQGAELKAATDKMKSMSEGAHQWKNQSWWGASADSWSATWWSLNYWSAADW